ncbi:hypothetical protein D3C87_1798370 [compost metagenome]
MALILLADCEIRILVLMLHEVGDFLFNQTAFDRPQHEARIDFGVEVHGFQHGILRNHFIFRHFGSVFDEVGSEVGCKLISFGGSFRGAGG